MHFILTIFLQIILDSMKNYQYNTARLRVEVLVLYAYTVL